jgi:glycosyltransferase involved in cell wall biosynthesis
VTDLSLVLPVRNQADHIGPILERYLGALDGHGWSFELVVVPNACTDASPRIVSELAARDPRIRVVENPAGGWGLSVRTGLDAARGRLVGYTNSARTEPETIPALVQLLIENGGSLVKVSRHSRGDLTRQIGSLLYNLECDLFLRTRLRDVNGTPKLFARSLLDRVVLRSDGDLIDVELLAQCRPLGVPVIEVPRPGFKRHGGRSTTDFVSAFKMYAGVVGLWLELRRGPARRPA